MHLFRHWNNCVMYIVTLPLHSYPHVENRSLSSVWWINYSWAICLPIQFPSLQLVTITNRTVQESKSVWLHPRSIICAKADLICWCDVYWWLVSTKHLSSFPPPLLSWYLPIRNHIKTVLTVTINYNYCPQVSGKQIGMTLPASYYLSHSWLNMLIRWLLMASFNQIFIIISTPLLSYHYTIGHSIDKVLIFKPRGIKFAWATMLQITGYGKCF